MAPADADEWSGEGCIEAVACKYALRWIRRLRESCEGPRPTPSPKGEGSLLANVDALWELRYMSGKRKKFEKNYRNNFH